MGDEIRKEIDDQAAGKLAADVKRFADAGDWDGLTENISNRVKEETEKATDTALDSLVDKFMTKMDNTNKFAVGQAEKEDENKFKSIGEYAAAVAASPNHLAPADPRLKALSVGSGQDGGYTVPADYQSEMSRTIVENSFFRTIGATVIPLSGDKITISSIKDEDHSANLFGGMIAFWKAEAASLTENSFKVNENELTPHKLTGLSYASNELLEDNASMSALISQLWGQCMAWTQDKAFVGGTGVSQPLGLINSSAMISVTRGAASVVTLANVADMLGHLYPSSFSRARWLINPRVYAELIQMPLSNAIFIDPNMGATKAPPSSILGIPLIVTEHCPYLNTAGDILLVDPSYYIIAEKPGIKVSVSEHHRFANDQTAFKITQRVDGQPLVDATTTLADGTHTVSPIVALAAG